mmetsp:Transcript_124894/g.388799  ORF Transcript_124894/g.388799 Transcript_124894/m.388799 type:complete len:182 (+) Transcript_124894:45-590(+)
MPWSATQIDHEEEDQKQGEQQTWGMLGSIIMYFVDGGRTCCSMRTGGSAAASSSQGSAEVWKRGSDAGQRPIFPEAKGEDPDGKERGTEGKATGHWEWPSWCLAYFEPCIEVYVVDDEEGRSGWVEAMPRERVKDTDGHDEFLSAEYMWDGELYIQDFSPEHVRRRGRTATVKDFLKNGDL